MRRTIPSRRKKEKYLSNATPVDAAIMKITVGSEIKKIETVMSNALFSKRSAAAYAIAEIEKVIKSMNAPDDGLQKSFTSLQVEFEKAVAPAEQLIESKTKSWTDLFKANVDNGDGLTAKWPNLPPL